MRGGAGVGRGPWLLDAERPATGMIPPSTPMALSWYRVEIWRAGPPRCPMPDPHNLMLRKINGRLASAEAGK